MLTSEHPFDVLERPDWVLHLPHSPPAHDLEVDLQGALWNEASHQLKFACAGRTLNELRKALNAIETRVDHPSLIQVNASFAPMLDSSDLQTYIIEPLDGDRKVRLPRSRLLMIENGFGERTVAEHDSSDESRQIQQYLAQHPNAALQAEEQSLFRWLSAVDGRLEWNHRVLSYALLELNLTSCYLGASSIPVLACYIEGNGSLRKLNLTDNLLLVRNLTPWVVFSGADFG